MPENTPRLNIPKPTNSEYFNRTNFNEILDIIDTNAATKQEVTDHKAEKATSTKLGHVKPDGTTITVDTNGTISTKQMTANNVSLEDAPGNFAATNVEGALEELFTNVSNGKTLVGGAITDVDPDVVVPTEPTFQELANAIGRINTGKKWAEGYAISFSGSKRELIEVRGLDFEPKLIMGWNEGTESIGFLNKYITEPKGGYRRVSYSPPASTYSLEGTATYNDGFKIAISDGSVNNTIYWVAFE